MQSEDRPFKQRVSYGLAFSCFTLSHVFEVLKKANPDEWKLASCATIVSAFKTRYMNLMYHDVHVRTMFSSCLRAKQPRKTHHKRCWMDSGQGSRNMFCRSIEYSMNARYSLYRVWCSSIYCYFSLSLPRVTLFLLLFILLYLYMSCYLKRSSHCWY